MIKKKVSINIISSFNHANFSGLLNSSDEFSWQINEVDYNQVFQTLTNPSDKIWKKKSNISIIWTTPDEVSSEFKKLQNGNDIDSKILKEDVSHFTKCIKRIKKNSDIILVPSWILKHPNESNLLFSYSKSSGLDYNLSFMNQHLFEELNNEKNIHILNSSKWLQNCGVTKAYNSKLWYLMKNPFSNEFLKEAIKDITNLYSSIIGLSKKLLILDLDDTLWGGIVGEVGWKNLRIGGHDYLGEAYSDFQNQIKALKKKGIILAIVSKNNQETALEAIKKHPEMKLKLEDFVAYRINWEDKAKNIVDIVKELNLGLQSTVFFDDSPFERGRVKEMLPEVFVPELPKNPTDYSNFLSSLHCFDIPHITKEDKLRAELYKSESKRVELKEKLSSLSDWINTLDLTVTIENVSEENIPRAIQLFNKTNQMNLTTRRLTDQEFNSWINEELNNLWTIRAKDKFGDYGIIGILSVSIKNNQASIIDFILSCRVVGRCIEDTMINFLKDYCKMKNINQISGEYKKTEKNLLCFKFLEKNKLITNSKHSFVFSPKYDKNKLPKINVISPLKD
tara:strand:+ start:1838 stop:3529 length:1692 start_codon:yes stop_codon:yes gene_type:complete